MTKKRKQPEAPSTREVEAPKARHQEVVKVAQSAAPYVDKPTLQLSERESATRANEMKIIFHKVTAAGDRQEYRHEEFELH